MSPTTCGVFAGTRGLRLWQYYPHSIDSSTCLGNRPCSLRPTQRNPYTIDRFSKGPSAVEISNPLPSPSPLYLRRKVHVLWFHGSRTRLLYTYPDTTILWRKVRNGGTSHRWMNGRVRRGKITDGGDMKGEEKEGGLKGYLLPWLWWDTAPSFTAEVYTRTSISIIGNYACSYPSG